MAPFQAGSDTQRHSRGRRRLATQAAVDAPGKPGYSRKTVAMPRRRAQGAGQAPAQTQGWVPLLTVYGAQLC